MTRPLDRKARLPQLGQMDDEAGEFWVDNPFKMPLGGYNLSAYERNRLFLNLGGTDFLDVSFASGADIDADSRSVVAADFNRDGAVDLLVASVGGGPLRLFLNRLPGADQGLRLELEGDPSRKSNRPAIGSRVTVRVGERRIVRDLFPPNGALGQGPVELFIGLRGPEGKMPRKVDELEIRWPGGAAQTFRNVPTGKTVAIREGEEKFRLSPLTRSTKAQAKR